MLQVLHEEGSIRSNTRIRETQSSEWGTYSDIAVKVLEGNPRKEADESSYLIALPDGETEGPYTKEQMKALYRNGRLAGNLLCCKTGASLWEPLETLIGKNSQQTASPEITGGRREGSRFSCSNEDDENSHSMPEMPPEPKTLPPLEEVSYGNPPLQDERSIPSGQEYNMRAFWEMTMLYLLSPLLIIVASATYAGDARFTLTVIGIGILFFLYAQISLLINTWRAWKCIQPIARYGRRVPSAGQAVGLLFVPVFNLYWMYVCFVGLADNASWFARTTRQTSLRLKAWPMFIFVLLTQLAFGSSIIANGVLPESRPIFNLLSLLWFPWPIAVFWYTERIIQSFPRPQERKKKYSQQEEAR